MAIQTDDCDIRDVRFHMDLGGNGDYYINLNEYDKTGKLLKGVNYRMAMSGGYAPHEVRMAFVALYRAMEAANLNEHPANETMTTKPICPATN